MRVRLTVRASASAYGHRQGAGETRARHRLLVLVGLWLDYRVAARATLGAARVMPLSPA